MMPVEIKSSQFESLAGGRRLTFDLHVHLILLVLLEEPEVLW